MMYLENAYAHNSISVTFHGIYSFPRDSFIANISMHFWATLDMTCSGSQGDLASPVRGGAGRALYEERLLSRSLCGDFNEFGCKSLVLWMRIYNKPKSS